MATMRCAVDRDLAPTASWHGGLSLPASSIPVDCLQLFTLRLCITLRGVLVPRSGYATCDHSVGKPYGWRRAGL